MSEAKIGARSKMSGQGFYYPPGSTVGIPITIEGETDLTPEQLREAGLEVKVADKPRQSQSHPTKE